jgi:hypothetical protein
MKLIQPSKFIKNEDGMGYVAKPSSLKKELCFEHHFTQRITGIIYRVNAPTLGRNSRQGSNIG